MFDRIKAMATRLSEGDVNERLETARASRAAAEKELVDAEQNFASVTVLGDETAQARERKRREELRGRVRRWTESESLLVAALAKAREQNAAEEIQRKVAAVDDALSARVEIAAELEVKLQELADVYKRLIEANDGTLALLRKFDPWPSDIPHCFSIGGMSGSVTTRFFGLTDGCFVPRGIVVGNPEVARHMGTLAERMREERPRVLAQLPRTQAPPEAA